MLFLDNAELLNARQQSFVAEFLESGNIFSEDRQEYIDCHNVILILSCAPSFAYLFNQRVPMIIELPELKDRPLEERFDLIHYFFSIEANNAKRNIELSREVMQALLLTEFSHNIKELEMEIKKASATACVRVIDDPDSSIEISLHDFKPSIQKSLIRLRSYSAEVEAVLGTKKRFIYDCHEGYREFIPDTTNNLYREIHNQYEELTKRGVSPATIQDVINSHIANLFKRYHYYAFDESCDEEQLSKIVDMRIIKMVKQLLSICREELQYNYKPSVFYGLCLHINSLLTLQLDQNRVDNEKIIHIVQEYPREYAISVQFAQSFKEAFQIELPMEEIVIITMFLIKDEAEDKRGHPVLLYILHGRGTASALQDVTERLTHGGNVYSYDLMLEKDTRQALEEIRSLILKIDSGQGVIVIYDMGSIRSMLDTIAEENNVKLRCIYVPITLIGIEIARKCQQEEDIDDVYHTTSLEMQKMFSVKDNRKEIIITLCHTGEGGAYQLKQYIDQYSSLDVKTVAMAVSKRETLVQQVLELKKVYKIHCFVGTYDPKLLGIPFIPISKVFENKPEDIDRILMFEPIQSKHFDYTAIYTYLEEQFRCVSVAKLKSILPNVIDQFGTIYSLNSEQKIGLFIHIACLLEHCKEGKSVKRNKELSRIISLYEEDFRIVSKILKPLEKKFNILIDDDQIAVIIMIVNKI